MKFIIKALIPKKVQVRGPTKYYQAIRYVRIDVPVLNPDEEHSLAMKYFLDKDIQSRNKLIEHNQRFVAKIANEYARKFSGIEFEDLLQEGNLGLTRAIEKYDPAKGRLTTYADSWIRAFIRKFISEWLETNKKEVSATTEGEEGPVDVIELTPSGAPTPEEELQEKQKNKGIQLAMKKLNDNEQFVITNRYFATNPLKLQEVGKRLNVSMQRAQQIQDAAVTKLKKEVAVLLKSLRGSEK